jgi:hypothetical protein
VTRDEPQDVGAGTLRKDVADRTFVHGLSYLRR